MKDYIILNATQFTLATLAVIGLLYIAVRLYLRKRKLEKIIKDVTDNWALVDYTEVWEKKRLEKQIAEQVN